MAKKKGPDKALINKAFRIKPVFSDTAGNLHFVTPVDVYENLLTEQQTVAQADGLKELATIDIEIPMGFRELPKPKIAHVLPEIPKEFAKETVAFELHMRDAMLTGEDFSVPATVTLYSGKLPDEVSAQPVIAMGKTFDKPFGRQRRQKPAEAFNPAAVAVLKQPVTAPKTAHFTRRPTPPPPTA